MKLSAIAATDPGRVRKNNEDYPLIDAELDLFIVCDGLGGHADGEVASRTAATVVREQLREKKGEIARHRAQNGASRDEIVEMVVDAVRSASAAVHQLGGESSSGAATTLTLMLGLGDKALMAHVGDTRLYLRRGKELHQLSEDHTAVGELVKRGELDPAKAKNHRFANVLSRAIGREAFVDVDTLMFDVCDRDTFILVSDGIVRHVENGEIAEVLDRTADLKDVPRKLIDLANARGGKDNSTVLAVRAGADDSDRTIEADRTETLQIKIEVLRSMHLFRFLTHAEVLKLLSVCREKVVLPGDTVIAEGALDDSLYIIADGELTVSRDGTQIAKLQRGAHFGEMALINRRPRSATVRAEARARLLAVAREPFNELVRKNPDLGVKLLWCLASALGTRLDDTTIQLSQAGSTTLQISTKDLPFRSEPS